MQTLRIIVILLFLSNTLSAQLFRHEVKIPIAGYLHSNLFSSFAPNYYDQEHSSWPALSIEYNLIYKEHWYLGLGYQYVHKSHFDGIAPQFKELGTIGSTIIDQRYLKVGYRNELSIGLDYKVGLLLINNSKTTSSFICARPFPTETLRSGTIYQKYALGLDVSISYEIYKGLFLELNSNLTNSQLKDTSCTNEYHYGHFLLHHTNLKVGYRF